MMPPAIFKAGSEMGGVFEDQVAGDDEQAPRARRQAGRASRSAA
jgi:hypothetical protein